jgi:signal transduction histidine kinase
MADTLQPPNWLIELTYQAVTQDEPHPALEGWMRGLVQKTMLQRASLWVVDASGKMIRQAAVWPAGQQGKTPSGELPGQILAGRPVCMDAAGVWTSLASGQVPAADASFTSLYFPLPARQRVIGCLVVEGLQRNWQLEFPWLVLAAAFIAQQMDGFQLAHLLRTRGTQPVYRQTAQAEHTKNLSDDERIKSEFIALVSHELRTPLNAMLGMSEMLLNTPLMDNQKEYAVVVHDSAQVLEHVVAELLEFAEIQAGKISLQEQPYDPRAVVKTVVDELADSAAKKGIKLNHQVEPGTPHSMVGDPYRLRQMLHHLVENAVKYTEKGSIDLRVRQGVDESGMPLLVVEVEDSGIGMDEEEQKRLFQPFGQADSSKTRKYGGTGLGLALVKALVKLHQGRVELRSEKGVGSCFCLHIPARVQQTGDERDQVMDEPIQAEGGELVSDPLEGHVAEDESILDTGVLNDLRKMEESGQNGLLKELIGMFFEEGLLQLNQFRRNTVEDEKKAVFALRQLRDMAGNLGARRLKAAVDVILQQALPGPDGWSERVAAVEQEFRAACDMLRIERDR